MQTVSQPKSLWSGEIGLIAVLAILGLLCLYIAIKTIEPAYAFHMGLGFICAAIAIFAIFQRFNKRDAARPPLEINGLPNYNFSVVKFTTVMALFWGLAGMAVGVYIASELAFPDLNLEPWFNFVRLRRQRAARDVVLRRSAHLSGPARRGPRPLVRGARLQLLHPDRRHGLFARHHRK